MHCGLFLIDQFCIALPQFPILTRKTGYHFDNTKLKKKQHTHTFASAVESAESEPSTLTLSLRRIHSGKVYLTQSRKPLSASLYRYFVYSQRRLCLEKCVVLSNVSAVIVSVIRLFTHVPTHVKWDSRAEARSYSPGGRFWQVRAEK